MPVQAGDFDDLVIAAPFFVEAPFDPGGNNQQIDYAGAYMQPVKTRDHEKGRAELCRSHRIAPGPHGASTKNGAAITRSTKCQYKPVISTIS